MIAETKEKVVANLANFAYDPYNFTFLRQVWNFYVQQLSWLQHVLYDTNYDIMWS